MSQRLVTEAVVSLAADDGLSQAETPPGLFRRHLVKICFRGGLGLVLRVMTQVKTMTGSVNAQNKSFERYLL